MRGWRNGTTIGAGWIAVAGAAWMAIAATTIAFDTDAAAATKRGAKPKAPTPGVAGQAWISLADLRKSLAKQKPATVVFDIDDTALFSTMAFVYAQGAFEGPTQRNAFRDPYFWTLVNDSLDARWSRPKAIADTLIAWHVSRGDTVAFVTARNASTPPSDRTALLMQKLFRMPTTPTVLFTDQKPKVDAIRSLHPRISYGDSDGDIKDTWAADSTIRAIRIVRGRYSSNPSPHEPGSQGEEILENSAD
jgi:HAD superfamily phosphatase (TIGR01672 family)